jgi:hypothetical protein
MHLRCSIGGNMVKHMAYPAVAMHHVPSISPAYGHSLIGSMPLFGQEISSSTIWTHTTGRLIPNSG